MDYIGEYLVNLFLSDATLAGIVGDRIYVGPIQDNPQPDYPSLTIKRRIEGYEERSFPGGNFQLVISCQSTNSYDECWLVQDRIKSLIHCERGASSDGAQFWVTYRRCPPIEDSDRTERQIYILHGIYDVDFIG